MHENTSEVRNIKLYECIATTLALMHGAMWLSCVLDERVDVWSLGCLLFFMMYGASPFERALGEAGGSLPLAIANGRLAWPPREGDPYPQDLRELVTLCLNGDAGRRPRAAEVIARTQDLLARC